MKALATPLCVTKITHTVRVAVITRQTRVRRTEATLPFLSTYIRCAWISVVTFIVCRTARVSTETLSLNAEIFLAFRLCVTIDITRTAKRFGIDTVCIQTATIYGTAIARDVAVLILCTATKYRRGNTGEALCGTDRSATYIGRSAHSVLCATRAGCELIGTAL
jgi:uncharacterized low-complexity protein